MNIPLPCLLARIEHAGDDEIDDIITAITQRYNREYPDWEIAFLSLPKNDPQACIQRLEEIAAQIRGRSGHG